MFDDIHKNIEASNQRRKLQKKEAQKRFYKKNKRLTFTVPIEDYENLKKRASLNGRAVSRQIYEESKAYRRAQFLPPEQIAAKIHIMTLELNRIGVNINQIAFHTNFFNRVIHQKNLVKEFEELQYRIDQFVQQPWTIPQSKIKK